MLINQSIKDNQFHSFFASFSSSTPFLFLLSVLTFFAFPILGCIPILLLLQVRISQRFLKGENLKKRDNFIFNQTNLFYLFLVLFATTIYGTTYNIRADIYGYLNLYSALSKLDVYGFINHFPQQYYEGVEPLSFFVPHLAGMLFGHSDGLFLLIQSLTFNLIVILLAYKSFPFFYPTIILINITSHSYFQYIFIQRQYYSFLFLLAMSLVPSIALNILFLILAYLTHRSSIIYSAPLFFVSVFKAFDKYPNIIIKSLLIKPIRNIFGSLLNLLNKKTILLIGSIIFPFINIILLRYISLDEHSSLKFQTYTKNSDEYTPFLLLAVTVLPEFIFIIIVLGLPLANESIAQIDYKEITYYIITLISLIMITYVYLGGLNTLLLRGLHSWTSLKGFFYPVLFLALERLRAKSQNFSQLLFSCLMSLAASGICMYLIFNFYHIYCAYRGSDVLDNLMNNRSVNYRSIGFFNLQNVNNDMPSVANNLFDYLIQFNLLINSPDDFWRKKAM